MGQVPTSLKRVSKIGRYTGVVTCCCQIVWEYSSFPKCLLLLQHKSPPLTHRAHLACGGLPSTIIRRIMTCISADRDSYLPPPSPPSPVQIPSPHDPSLHGTWALKRARNFSIYDDPYLRPHKRNMLPNLYPLIPSPKLSLSSNSTDKQHLKSWSHMDCCLHKSTAANDHIS